MKQAAIIAAAPIILMVAARVTVGEAPALGPIARAKAQETADVDEDYLVSSGEFFGGELIVESFSLPKHAVAYVREDFLLDSAGDIVIEGTLVCLPSERGDDGPTIHMVSAGTILVTGRVHGAPGRSFGGAEGNALGKQGGTGSSIVIEAPHTHTSGCIVAGTGGSAGAGGAGGSGGSILTIGGALRAGFNIPERALGIYGGHGGRPGPGSKRIHNGRGGAGGDGGSALSFADRANVPERYRHLFE